MMKSSCFWMACNVALYAFHKDCNHNGNYVCTGVFKNTKGLFLWPIRIDKRWLLKLFIHLKNLCDYYQAKFGIVYSLAGLVAAWLIFIYRYYSYLFLKILCSESGYWTEKILLIDESVQNAHLACLTCLME